MDAYFKRTLRSYIGWDTRGFVYKTLLLGKCSSVVLMRNTIFDEKLTKKKRAGKSHVVLIG